MEVGNCHRSIGKICSRLPRSVGNIVSDPIYEIQEFAPSDPRVQNGPNLKLWKPVHLDGVRSRLDASRDRIGYVRFEEADVEDRMDVHGCGKIQSKRRSADRTNDSEGTEATNIQLGGRTDCSDVVPQEPHLSTWQEGSGRPTPPIGRNLHGLPSFEELPLKNHLGLLQLFDIGVRGGGPGVGIGWK